MLALSGEQMKNLAKEASSAFTNFLQNVFSEILKFM